MCVTAPSSCVAICFDADDYGDDGEEEEGGASPENGLAPLEIEAPHVQYLNDEVGTFMFQRNLPMSSAIDLPIPNCDCCAFPHLASLSVRRAAHLKQDLARRARGTALLKTAALQREVSDLRLSRF